MHLNIREIKPQGTSPDSIFGIGLGRQLAKMPMTLLLIGLMLLFFLLTRSLPHRLEAFCLDTPLVHRGQIWRVLSSHLLRAHLCSFMLSLWLLLIFGRQLEEALGPECLGPLSLTIVLSASASSLLLDAPRQDPSLGRCALIYGYYGALFAYVLVDQGSLARALSSATERRGLGPYTLLIALLTLADQVMPVSHRADALVALLVGLLMGMTMTRSRWPSWEHRRQGLRWTAALFSLVLLLSFAGVFPTQFSLLLKSPQRPPIEAASLLRRSQGSAAPAWDCWLWARSLKLDAKARPDDQAQVLKERGLAYYFAGQRERAADDWQRASELQPTQALPRVLWALALARLGQLAEARVMLTRAAELQGAEQIPELWFWRARMAPRASLREQWDQEFLKAADQAGLGSAGGLQAMIAQAKDPTR